MQDRDPLQPGHPAVVVVVQGWGRRIPTMKDDSSMGKTPNRDWAGTAAAVSQHPWILVGAAWLDYIIVYYAWVISGAGLLIATASMRVRRWACSEPGYILVHNSRAATVADTEMAAMLQGTDTAHVRQVDGITLNSGGEDHQPSSWGRRGGDVMGFRAPAQRAMLNLLGQVGSSLLGRARAYICNNKSQPAPLPAGQAVCIGR